MTPDDGAGADPPRGKMHLHYDQAQDGHQVRVRVCDLANCAKDKPLTGTLAAVMASAQRPRE